jgi:uncharacterized protein
MESEEILTSMTRRERVESLLQSFGGVVVACSGGVDSVLLAAVAARVLGDRAVAATAVSESLALGELEDARAAAKAAGLRHIEVRTREIENPAYSRNAPDRCFHCKDTAYGHFTDLAKELGLPVVVDGTNADDTGDYRPGRQAAREHGVRSPLAEAGLGKEEIRKWARELGLGVWDKPAAACLSSRIPYGSEVTPEKLRRIDLAEAALKAAGLRQCRVRDHGGLARIEVEPEALHRVLELRDVLLPSFKGLGYAYVTVDLQGFRSGSMNEVISVPSPA